MKVSRRNFLAGVAVSALLIQTPAAAWRNGKYTASLGGMLLHLSEPQYFTGSIPLLNWWNVGVGLTGQGSQTLVSSGPNGTTTDAWGLTGAQGGAYYDPNTGELNNPAQTDVVSIGRLFFVPPPNYGALALAGNPWWVGEQFTIACDGTTVISSVGGLGSGGSFSTSGGGNATLTIGSGPGGIGLSFTVPNPSDPPRNIRVFQSRYAANAARSEVFNPDFVSYIRQFGVLRFMDWMSTIGSGATDISQLADASYTYLLHGPPTLLVGTMSISGTTLTISNTLGGFVGLGSVLSGGTIVPGTQITAGLTGGGQDGTYTITPSQSTSSGANLGIATPSIGQFGGTGPKGAIHPSLVCNLANLTHCNVHYNIPATMTNVGMAQIATYFRDHLNPQLWVKFEFINENWNSGQISFFYCNAQNYPNGGTGNPVTWAGYRAAQLWEQAYNVYGAASRSRWKGALGSQCGDPSVTTRVLTGALYWLANGSARSVITDLFDEVEFAPYFGSGESSSTISAVTTGATTTVTDGTPQLPTFHSAGDKVRVFFSVASGLSAYNNTTVTVTTGGTNSFQFTSPTTTGSFTNSGPNYTANGWLFDLMDTSLTNFTNTPATYPTKYTYFLEQVCKSILTGTADNGYATQSSENLSSGASCLPNLIQQHALIANTYGLVVRCYEGGWNLGGNLDQNLLPPSGNYSTSNQQSADYFLNAQFDASQPGSPYTMAAVYAAYAAAVNFGSSGYPAQFSDLGEPSPWTGQRFLPGDDGNAKWQAILGVNKLGLYVDPTPPATWTGGFISDANNPFYTTAPASAVSYPIGFGSNAAGKLVVSVVSPGSPTLTSVTVTTPSSGTLTFTPDVAYGAGQCGIYSVDVPANMGTQTIAINWVGAGFFQRSSFAYLLSGLISDSALATATGSSQSLGGTVNYTKGGALIAVAAGNFTGARSWVAGANEALEAVSESTTPIFGTSGMFNIPFSSPILNVNPGISGGHESLAVFR